MPDDKSDLNDAYIDFIEYDVSMPPASFAEHRKKLHADLDAKIKSGEILGVRTDPFRAQGFCRVRERRWKKLTGAAAQ